MVIEKICIERFLVAKTFGMNCSFQVETNGIEITSSGTSHAKSASHVEFSETNEETDTKISEFFSFSSQIHSILVLQFKGNGDLF